MSDTPVLQAGDRIHVVIPIRAHEALIEDLKKAYAAQGVTIFMTTPLPVPNIEIVSIIRAAPKSTPGQMMTDFGPLGPRR